MNRRRALFLCSGLLGLARAATAADTLAGGLPRAAAGRAEPLAAPATPWSLRLEAQGVAVDETALRVAVARELARADVPAGTEPVRIQVSVARGGSLLVRYRSPAGAELSRSVAAPNRADEVPEASALLVGNLARDEVSPLLAELAQQRQAAAAAPASAPAVAPAAPSEAPPLLPLDSVNLSLFYPLTLRSATEQRHLACELGLFYSRSAAVSGVSLTALGVSRVDGPAHGLQLGGIGYWHGGPGTGARVGSFFGASSGRFVGLSASGLATLHGGELVGAELAGLTSVSTGPLEGVQASGMFDYAAGITGLQAAGLASVSAGPIDGVQVAGVTSIAEDIRGLQLSLVNIGGSIAGAQVGLVNVADDVTGLQLGLVNVAHSVQGQSIGFVPYNQKGGLKIVTWYDSTEPFNLGVRFHAGALYLMPTFAFDPGSAALVNDPARMRYAVGTSIGLRVPIDRLFIDIEASESQPSQGWKAELHEDSINLRYRALAGYRVLPGLSVFAGGGLRQHGSHVGPDLSAGMELL